jgi:hypothetical protein
MRTMTATLRRRPLESGELLRPEGKSSNPVWNPDIALAECAPFGFQRATMEQIPEAHAAAESIMGMKLAPVSAFANTHERTGGTVYVLRERPKAAAGATSADAPPAEPGSDISAVVLLLPLSPRGEDDMRSGEFNTYAPQPNQMCAPGDPFPAMYVWLYAGRGMRARLNVLRACVAWRDGEYTQVKCYGRGASPEGAHAMEHLGFHRLGFGVPDLFFIDKRPEGV